MALLARTLEDETLTTVDDSGAVCGWLPITIGEDSAKQEDLQLLHLSKLQSVSLLKVYPYV